MSIKLDLLKDYFAAINCLNILAYKEEAMLDKELHHCKNLFLKVKIFFLYQLQDRPKVNHEVF